MIMIVVNSLLVYLNAASNVIGQYGVSHFYTSGLQPSVINHSNSKLFHKTNYVCILYNYFFIVH